MAKPGPKGPSKYSQKYVKRAKRYIKECEDEQIQVVKQRNEEKGYEMFDNKLKVNLPTLEGLALYLKVHRDTINDWRTKYEEFSDVISELMQKQASMLLSKGLSGEYNSTIAKLILSKHGYRDKVDVKMGEFDSSDVNEYA